jgi:hypothetical protein
MDENKQEDPEVDVPMSECEYEQNVSTKLFILVKSFLTM